MTLSMMTGSFGQKTGIILNNTSKGTFNIGSGLLGDHNEANIRGQDNRCSRWAEEVSRCMKAMK